MDFFDNLQNIPTPEELSIGHISVAFTNNNIIYNNQSYPLGTFSLKALNFTQDNGEELQDIIKDFHQYLKDNFYNTQNLSLEIIKKIDNYIEKINSYLPSLLIFDELLPLKNRLTDAYEEYTKHPHDNDKAYQNYVRGIIHSYEILGDELITFYAYMSLFCEQFISKLKVNDAENYAYAFEDYFFALDISNFLLSSLLINPKPLSRVIKHQSEFTTLDIENKKTLVEVITFPTYLDFLHYEFLKALQSNHTIRVCQNCGYFFLQTTQYYTKYCENIAPRYTNKTCRQVGATLTEKEKVVNSPIHQLYKKCYKKLNQRYNRKRLTDDQYNHLVSQIIDLKEQALQGEISIDDLINKYNSI